MILGLQSIVSILLGEYDDFDHIENLSSTKQALKDSTLDT